MSTPTKRQRVLDEIYATLPTVECKGLCWQHCAAVPTYEAEFERMERAAKRSLPVLPMDVIGRTKIVATNGMKDLGCPLLMLRRCSIYADRPFICRIFGVAEGLPCPHGCAPAKKLSDQEVIKIQRKLEKL